MSQRRGTSWSLDLDTVLDSIQRWYHVPTLVVLLGFMLWVRIQNYSRFITDSGILFSSNDPWYHLRQVTYTVNNWPNTMPFDAWTYFPQGTASSQFGTLFDQVVATVAIIIGLGNPSDQTIGLTLLFAPAVLGILVAIPVYVAGKRIGDRFSGLVGVLVLALASGGFLSRSLVGASDHHVAEALLQMTALVAVMIALTVGEEERPVWELVVDREWDALRRPLGWSALAGVAIALYIWTWPPGVLLLGVLGLFFLFQLIADHLRGKSPDHLAFVGVVTMGVTGLLLLLPMDTTSLSVVGFSPLQPGLAFAGAGFCAALAWLAREFESRDLSPRLYPVAVLGGLATIAVLAALVLPDLFAFFIKNVDRLIGLSGGARAGTVGEASPLPAPIITLFGHYGLAAVAAVIGAVAILVVHFRRRDAQAQSLLVLFWAVVVFLATLTQVRFEYYLPLAIAVLTAYVVSLARKYMAPAKTIRDAQVFQVITIVAVLMILVTPMAVNTGPRGTPALEEGSRWAPSNGVIGWSDGLDWMEQNTPQPGTYGGAGENMSFYGTNPKQNDFDYPAGAYGVISWWDYGHWITQRGERIPTANPFQQGSSEAANFLLAPDEGRAADVVEGMSEDDASPRYVMVDWKMASTWANLGGKFFAPQVFYTDGNVSREDFRKPIISVNQNRPQTAYYLRTQRYYESMVNRLWYFHGSAQKPNPIVFDYEEQQAQGRTFRFVPRGNNSRYQYFRSLSRDDAMEQAREFVREDGSAQIGGMGPNPPEKVDALEQYRLVRNSNFSTAQSGSAFRRIITSQVAALAQGKNITTNQEARRLQLEILSFLYPGARAPPWTKIFERVDGATIEGTGPANANVTASVQMQTPGTNGSFTYRQYAETGPDGEFTMTVPYSSTGYDNWGPENGHTDVSVQATGPYQFNTDAEQNETGALYNYNASAHVSEGKVIGEDQSPVTVDLTKQVYQGPDQNSTDGTSGQDGSQSGNDSPAQNETTSGDQSGSSTSDGSGGSTDTNDTATTSGDGQSAIAGPAESDAVVPPA
jgi:dolichyl-diphosphooligosaccharide--protein glycosyltransferase